MRIPSIAVALSAASLTLSAAPWRLSEALDLPSWIRLSGEQRTRYETLDGQFRAGRRGGDQALALRTSLTADFHTEPVGFLAEVLDARQYLSDAGSPIDNTMVNALDVLQAHVRWEAGRLIPGGTNTVRLGRETLDLGNRRLVARNAYRNTINSFTGIDWLWSADEGGSVRAFYFLPVQRLPEDADSLLDNQIEADWQGFGRQFFGAYATSARFAGQTRAEAYWLVLDEDASVGSRHRRLHTPGGRLFRRPAAGQVDFEFEAALQRGTSRANVGNLPALDHTAWMGHAAVGYTVSSAWMPRVGISYQQTSGDRSPGDTENHRFDTLFGARRFEFGPTGIYGAVARANLRSPEYSLSIRPTKWLETSVSHRFLWLDSDTDAFSVTGVRDASGGSGTEVGQQVELRNRLDLIPGTLRADVGVAWLVDGPFLRNAPNATRSGDSTYLWFEATLTF